ncbi:MAG: DNA mismatch repair endonuclease MutL [Dehalococcoidales bacterium]|nr:DNA mismatch repair endonuclease MutL [Dehalococcoidales bacterium]
MPIKLLDERVIAQIAAGEVVDRPASVIKELIENSLDAGSRQISVEAKGGGVSLMRVTDDGSGIPAGEVGLIFQRHATSKVTSLADLHEIRSFGFRGEALSSIAAAGEVEILTCAAGESSGTHLRVDNGEVSRQEQGRSPGTTVTVHNLFRRVPARLKFLKSASTENSHIANVISQYALAFPEVRFSLTLDGKMALQTNGRGQLIDSIIEVYGVEVAQNMLAVGSPDGEWQSGKNPVTVSGLAGAPTVNRSSRGYLSFFVNRRWINSRLLSWAVEEAYRGLLMTGRHPVAVLNIAMPPAEVDVNIHPAKSEVRFQNESAVFSAVQKAVRRALVEQMPVPRIEEVATGYRAPASHGPGLFPTNVESFKSSPPNPASQPLAEYLPVLRVVGQVKSNYIVAEGPDGLYVIDQHAAHERILFEKVKQQRSQRDVEIQSLLEPVTLEVSPRQEAALKSYCDGLAEFGFIIEPFGEKAAIVRAVPGLLEGKDWMAMLRELLDALFEGGTTDWGEKAAATIACHSAVRAGQVLSEDEMRALVRQLEQVANPHTCPHGRPTMIHLSAGQLSREFGRS